MMMMMMIEYKLFALNFILTFTYNKKYSTTSAICQNVDYKLILNA